MNYLTKIFIVIVFFFSVTINSAQATLVREVIEFPVSIHNINEFASSIAFRNGSIYTVNVETGESPSNGINLHTVVRKGVLTDKGTWAWTKYVIDKRTLEDNYHTQASIGIDKDGFIHVAYNMHHMPWQYSVSTAPYDISSFQFRGQPLSFIDRMLVKKLNKTPFPTLGSAAIPGNQITYPTFFNDRLGNLYITYRFATRPKRAFSERGFAAGLARYDTALMQWQALGGDIRVTSKDVKMEQDSALVKAFAYSPGWAPYLLRLEFDTQNRMHTSWLWRQGGPGPRATNPMYALSIDGGISFINLSGQTLDLPISVNSTAILNDRMRETPMAPYSDIAVDRIGAPMILLHEFGKTRTMTRADLSTKRWSQPQNMPHTARQLHTDNRGGQWAVATGPKIFFRKDVSEKWKKVFDSSGKVMFGYPQIAAVADEDRFFLYTQNTDVGRVKIFDITY